MNEFIKFLNSLNYGAWRQDGLYKTFERKKAVFNIIAWSFLLLAGVWLIIYFWPVHSSSINVVNRINNTGAARQFIYGLLSMLALAVSYMGFYYKFHYSNQMRHYSGERRTEISRYFFDNPLQFKKYVALLVDYSGVQPGEEYKNNVIDFNSSKAKKLKKNIEGKEVRLLINHLEQQNFKFFDYHLHEFIEPIWDNYKDSFLEKK